MPPQSPLLFPCNALADARASCTCVRCVPCACGVCEGDTNVQFVLDHWQLVEGDPRDPSTRAGQLVLAVRRRKGLKEEIPSLNDLADKL